MKTNGRVEKNSPMTFGVNSFYGIMPTFSFWRNEMIGSPLSQLLSGRMDVTEFIALLVALVVGITVHEFSHALAATWLGDPLPGRQGRLSLSPAAHLDPFGSLMFFVGGFGWGRPVQSNPYALRAGPRSGMMLVALAGPISNIILAAFFAIIVRAIELGIGASGITPELGFVGAVVELFTAIVWYNLILGFFNLIPISPLDGFTILLGLLPPTLAFQFEQVRNYGMLLLFALVFFVPGVLSVLLYRPVGLLFQLLVGF